MVATLRLVNAASRFSSMRSLLFAAQLVDMLVNALEAAVGSQQLRRRLVAHARHAGDVVGAVAFKAQEIGELRRLHAVTPRTSPGP